MATRYACRRKERLFPAKLDLSKLAEWMPVERPSSSTCVYASLFRILRSQREKGRVTPGEAREASLGKGVQETAGSWVPFPSRPSAARRGMTRSRIPLISVKAGNENCEVRA